MKRIVRVWFNHWFSSAYHIINLLKQDENINFHVIGTNQNINSVIKLACDEWYEEPVFETDEEYIEYCINFCKTNQVEVFVPRRRMIAVCKNLNLFKELNVKVLVDNNYEKLCILNDKEKTYNLFEKLNINVIPERYIIDNVEDFCKAYKLITANFERACIKITNDEGAVSFRVIDDSIEGYKGLRRDLGSKITFEYAKKILSEQKIFENIMVMPYLTGIEASIDCLKTNSGLIIVPRLKTGGRVSEIVYDNKLIELCNEFFEKISLNNPCNIQFKYYGENPFLLEINTRMSGGIPYSCLGANVNIPNIAINQLLGINKPWEINKISRKVAYIEMPILV